ncbi:MAG: hypothetical protein AUG07_02420 [Acidobacteria bacterium 13_1_20CM_2_60_10]|nr:MAG: hypothetical protein AUG07_02420 [Acidobacteria bacterium 13_1_20CM_2_60_10]
MAAGSAAGFGSDTQVARVHKFYVLRGFLEPFRVSPLGQIRTILERRIAWLNVGFFFRGIVLGSIPRGSGCDENGGVAPMAIGATEMNSLRRMHGGFVGRGVAGDTAGGFAIRFFPRLAANRS